MKILLVTDIPPCKDFTAGLVLDQLCRFLPPGSLACFAMVNPEIDAKRDPSLAWIPVAYSRKRAERALRPFRGRASVSTAWPVEKLRRRVVVPRLRDQVVEYARREEVDLLWVVLQGQTITQIATEAADVLDVPLITQVWDPLNWWLAANSIDRFNGRRALADFDRAIRRSETCIVASWAMKTEYEERYRTRCVPVVAGLPRAWMQEPDTTSFPHPGVLRMGVMGQFYAGAEWLQLVRALDMSGWQVRGRRVTITVLGPSPPPGRFSAEKVQYLGWQSQERAIQILSRLHVLYCPYPFEHTMATVARLSFPSKLVGYFAAGRPTLFQGPRDSCAARYIADHKVGLVVPEKDASAIYNALCRLVDQPEVYNELARNAQAAFLSDFTLEVMRNSFENAIGRPLRSLAAGAPIGSDEVSSVTYFPDVRAIVGRSPLRSDFTRLAARKIRARTGWFRRDPVVARNPGL